MGRERPRGALGWRLDLVSSSLLASWVAFPVVLAAIGAGCGVVVERAAGCRISGVLVVPLGLAAAIVIASLLTAWSVTAPAAAAVVGVLAVAGLVIGQPFRRLLPWPSLMALAVLAAYGAPVLLSGSATFLGYFRLDDTATWLGLTDQVMAHGRSLANLAPSLYSARLETYMATAYPLGSFMLLGIGHALTQVDSAWIFQPYLACCGAAVGLGIYALTEPLVRSAAVRALVAFLAAQPALLYGYSLWGGIKELTAAFLLVLGAALVGRAIAARPENPRHLLPIAVAAAALIVTMGAGAAAWVVPALVGVVVVWAIRARGEPWRVAREVGMLGAATALLALPVWVVLPQFLTHDSNLFVSGHAANEELGSLFQPLSGWQLAGIWPVGDFRLRAPTLPTAPLIALALLAGTAALWSTVRRRQFALVTYVLLALASCAVFYLVGSTPWVLAKVLAIASPALLAAALVGGALLWSRRRLAGLIVLLAIGASVVWSNALAYHDVTLAPRSRLLELQRIGQLVNGKGPTLINETEFYAYRHFLRSGAPFEPAVRPIELPLRSGIVLSGNAWADLDSFSLSTLEQFRSIVTRSWPFESRPPSNYRLVWHGRYYQLWQRTARPSTSILAHIPLGESNALPYCGSAENGPSRSLCSINPVAIPRCSSIQSLGRQAIGEQAELVAAERAEPISVRGDQTLWPLGWIDGSAGHVLEPTAPGTAVGHIAVASDQRYGLWLSGSFARGFSVSFDGRNLGAVKDQLGGWVHLADLFLSAGTHTFRLTYPHADLTPGTGINPATFLAVLTLAPQSPPSSLIAVPAHDAARLCGRPLNWIELVRMSS
jgi:hypothetical protein